MAEPLTETSLQIIDLLLDESHRGTYVVRTWRLTEAQRRSLVALLGRKPDTEVLIPQEASRAAMKEAERAGMVVVDDSD